MQKALQIVFYNVDNFFDPMDAAHTLDEDFTPTGRKKWGEYRYNQKVSKIAKTIAGIGEKNPLAFVGLAEVETEQVCKDLVENQLLAPLNMGYIHRESSDIRGIDVALLYNKNLFTVESVDAHPVEIDIYQGHLTSRDILEVKGILNGTPIRIFVNHWPSQRRRGNRKLRKRASDILKKRLKELDLKSDYIIIMGDFNDNPDAPSLTFLQDYLFTNTLSSQWNENQGSLKYMRKWLLFDQIFLSLAFFDSRDSLAYESGQIYNPIKLQDPSGRNKAQPFRTFIGKNYIGGQSDHFPVVNQILCSDFRPMD